MAEMAKSISTEEAKGIDIDELLKRLSADKNGLSTSVAKDRHQKLLYGYNEITGKKGSPLLKLLDHIRTAAVYRCGGILAGKEGGQCN
ncbi:MAG: cation-transporting P-type ATPase [Halobacteriota archaeon]